MSNYTTTPDKPTLTPTVTHLPVTKTSTAIMSVATTKPDIPTPTSTTLTPVITSSTIMSVSSTLPGITTSTPTIPVITSSMMTSIATTIPSVPTPTPTMPVIQPALPSTVGLTLTIVYIMIFGLLFLLVYAQLWMIWYYRHKRLSHQTLFLFMCLVWAGLRSTLFSFYFHDCDTANSLSVIPYWLLYSFPVCLQFSMLCLLVHFFAQIVLKSRYGQDPRKYKIPLRIFLGISVLAFLGLNAAFAWMTRSHEIQTRSSSVELVTIRVVLTETMFFLYGCALSVFIYKLAKTSSTHVVLEAKGTTVRTAVFFCVMITLIFLSRTAYNIVSIFPLLRKSTPNFGYDWINVTDQADVIVGDLSHGFAYVSFGIVLFIWEVLPISIVVIFFRVKRLRVGLVPTDFSQQQHGARVFFFDNPRRYDSEDDLSYQNSGASYREISSRHFSVNADASRSSYTPCVTPSGTPGALGNSFGGPSSSNNGLGYRPLHAGNGFVGSPARVVSSGKRSRYGSLEADVASKVQVHSVRDG